MGIGVSVIAVMPVAVRRWRCARARQRGRQQAAGVLIGVALLLSQASNQATAADASGNLMAFSELTPGPLPEGSPWRHQTIGKIKPNTAVIAGEAGSGRFLSITSSSSASAWSHAVPADLAQAKGLHWEWLIQGVPNRTGLNNKKNDDFAARVYVVFDYPLEKLSFGQRVGIRLARSIYGDVPAAAISYVWLPGARVDTLVDSPFTGRVKMIVAGSAQPDSGWQSVKRNIEADFQRAFGEEYGPGMPPLKAVIVTSDTDQSGGSVRASFARLHLKAN